MQSRLSRKWGTSVLAILLAVSAFGVGWSAVSAANPSYFNATWDSCNWTGQSRIFASTGQEWTFDSSGPGCLAQCYLYGQWINSGGTYYVHSGTWSSCGASSYHQYANSSQTELYGEHDVKSWSGYYYGHRSTDAYCGGSPC